MQLLQLVAARLELALDGLEGRDQALDALLLVGEGFGVDDGELALGDGRAAALGGGRGGALRGRRLGDGRDGGDGRQRGGGERVANHFHGLSCTAP